MAAEKAEALVLRTTDWSETSRIATLWTRELGKVRALAKGGRRLKSNFDNALDLLTVCGIVFLRKSAGSLDLLTEAQVTRRFPRLRQDLSALYAGYYVAELLDALTQEYDPHPEVYAEALAALEEFGPETAETASVPVRLARFEMVLLSELGYRLVLDACATCGGPVGETGMSFSAAAGGVVCRECRPRSAQPLSPLGLAGLRSLAGASQQWRRPWSGPERAEVRQVLGHYISHLLGRRPRLLPYLGS